ncbi:MAG TPA: hypothetical protein VIL09_19005 [Microvirga sp.]
MTDLTQLTAGLTPPKTASMQLLKTDPLGPRLYTTPTSALVVGATPVNRVDELLAEEPSLTRPVAYLLQDGPWLRVGETGSFDGRWDDHLRRPPLAAEQVVVVGSLHSCFGKDAILALQSAIYHQACRAGRVEVIGQRPERARLALTQPGLVARWMADLRTMLACAGVHALEPVGARLRPRVVLDPPPEAELLDDDLPLRSGVSIRIPLSIYDDPGARLYRLTFRDLRAPALARGDGACVVLAGAEMATLARGSIQDCLAAKRVQLVAKRLAFPTRDPGVALIGRDVAFPSLTNAGRALTGTNRSGDELWRPAA